MLLGESNPGASRGQGKQGEGGLLELESMGGSGSQRALSENGEHRRMGGRDRERSDEGKPKKRNLPQGPVLLMPDLRG